MHDVSSYIYIYICIFNNIVMVCCYKNGETRLMYNYRRTDVCCGTVYDSTKTPKNSFHKVLFFNNIIIIIIIIIIIKYKNNDV